MWVNVRSMYIVLFFSAVTCAPPGSEVGVHPLRAVPPAVHRADVPVGFTAYINGSS